MKTEERETIQMSPVRPEAVGGPWRWEYKNFFIIVYSTYMYSFPGLRMVRWMDKHLQCVYVCQIFMFAKKSVF